MFVLLGAGVIASTFGWWLTYPVMAAIAAATVAAMVLAVAWLRVKPDDVYLS